jgi:hypothetical protein
VILTGGGATSTCSDGKRSHNSADVTVRITQLLMLNLAFAVFLMQQLRTSDK